MWAQRKFVHPNGTQTGGEPGTVLAEECEGPVLQGIAISRRSSREERGGATDAPDPPATSRPVRGITEEE